MKGRCEGEKGVKDWSAKKGRKSCCNWFKRELSEERLDADRRRDRQMVFQGWFLVVDCFGN